MAITIDGDSGVSGVNGSATTPALQGTDSNTGIVFGTDTVQVATGGSTRATVDSSGQVGVGLTSPSSLLHLKSTSFPQLTVERDGSGGQGAGIKLLDGSGDENRFFTTDSSLVFDTGASSTELARIQSGGGISFNGDTAAANALDDYEEGTWTPTWGSNGTSPTAVTYVTQDGFYTKVGRLVSVTCTLDISAFTSGTGSFVTIKDLPFQTSGNNGTGSCRLENVVFSGDPFVQQRAASTTEIVIGQSSSNSATSFISPSNVGSQALVVFTYTYNTST